jgi:TonB family protein
MKLLALALLLAPIPLAAQTPAATTLPTDPIELLSLAAPLYDYTSPDMKPWHVRYHYQNFDQTGTPVSEGDFDYWWSTTGMNKASWTSGGQSYTEWHLADGTELRSGTKKNVEGMEHIIKAALLPALAKYKEPRPGDRPRQYFTAVVSSQPAVCVGSARSSTVTVQPTTAAGEQLTIKPSAGDKQLDSLDAASPGYCFDPHAPILIASHQNGTLSFFYLQNQTFQNHNVPGQFTISYVGSKRIAAKLADLAEVPADDPAFTPTPDAKAYVPETPTPVVRQVSFAALTVVKKVDPVYPLSGHGARSSGTVVVMATIAKDGNVKDATLVSSPDASLSAAALNAVRQWRYKPYTINGEPVEVNTRISLAFKP